MKEDRHTKTVAGAEAAERRRWFAEQMRHGTDDDRPEPRDYLDAPEHEDGD